MNNDKSLALRDHQAVALAADPADVAMTVQQVLGQVALIQQIMATAMKDGEHYGRIPGCGDKATLLKPGAEKLCLTFRLAPKYEVFEREFERGHREYRIQASLTSILTQKFIGEGVGICSTLENKYRFRVGVAEVTDKPVPRAYWDLRGEDPTKAQELLGGKGFTPKKVDGKGWMIAKGGERVETDSPADSYNTVLKMAKKRALVDAVLTATAASDIFTQDLEDIIENLTEVGAGEGAAHSGGNKPQPKPAPAPSKTQEVVVEVMTEERALSTRVHFGKNQGKSIKELSAQQRSWYVDDWLMKKERTTDPISVADRQLMEALKFLYPLAKDKASTVGVEHENQETAPLLTNLGKLIADAKGFTGEDLRDWLRTLMRGKQPILAADKEIEDLPAIELESILKNWKKVVPEVTVFRKKREEQDLLETAHLN